MRIKQSVEAFTFIQRQQGWQEACKQAARFVHNPLFEFHNGFVLRKSLRDPIDVPSLQPEMNVRRIGPADLALLETILPPLRVQRLAGKLEAGEICFAAILDGKIIAYVLAGFTGTPTTKEACLDIRTDEAYLWAGFALPAYRRIGVVKTVNLSLCNDLRARGYKHVVLLVEKRNVASLGHCRKMGYRTDSRIVFLRVFGWSTAHLTPNRELAP